MAVGRENADGVGFGRTADGKSNCSFTAMSRPVVSKMLRHSAVGITVDLYGHLSRETATAAADTYGAVLDAAAAGLAAERAAHDATTLRQQPPDGHLLSG